MGLPQVSIYVRITDAQGRRHYERLNRRTPQLGPGMVYCLRYEIEGKRKWETIGTDLNAAATACVKRESELILDAKAAATPKPSPNQPESLETLGEAFLRDRRTTFKKDGSPPDADTIASYGKVTREFLDIIRRKLPSEIGKQDLKDYIAALRLRISHRAVCNYYVSIVCFLHFCGVDHKRAWSHRDGGSAVHMRSRRRARYRSFDACLPATNAAWRLRPRDGDCQDQSLWTMLVAAAIERAV